MIKDYFIKNQTLYDVAKAEILGEEWENFLDCKIIQVFRKSPKAFHKVTLDCYILFNYF